MSCDCIKNLNQLLKERLNETAEVDAGIIVPDGGIRVRLLAYYHKKKKGWQLCPKVGIATYHGRVLSFLW